MNNFPNCPFCNLPTTFHGYSSDYTLLYSCTNHSDMRITIRVLKDNSTQFYKIFSLKTTYEICIYPKLNMTLYFNYYPILLSLPIDLSLTPENFLSKVKTYINFQ